MQEDRPKTLIPVEEDRPLLHYILEGLKVAGVKDLMVVTGYGASQIQEFVTERWTDDAMFVFNARWASWGNFHTVRMAIDQSPGLDLMTINSDVIVHPDVYSRVASSPGDLVLAVQRRPKLDQEDMRVELDGNHVRQIGKHVKMPRSHGEFSGVSLLRRPAAAVYSDLATDLEWGANTSGYYEDVYAAMLERVDVRAAFVRGDEYAEVDMPEDMTDAREVLRHHHDAWPAASTEPV
jgi:L-glutamine-phosphate cytidylyltransferase